MAKINVYDQTMEIINGNLKINEKLSLLSKLDLDGKPGCVNARKAIQHYKWNISDKKHEFNKKIYINNPFKIWRLEFVNKEWDVEDRVLDLLRANFPVLFNSNVKMRMPAEIKTVYLRVDDAIRSCVQNTDLPDMRPRQAANILLKKVGRLINQMIKDVNILNAFYAEYQAAERKRQEEQIAQSNREAEERRAFYKKYGVSNLYLTSIFNADKESVCIVGPYAFQAEEEVEKDWNYYSKSYGFPKVTVTGRYVTAFKNGKMIRRIELDSFRGNWMIDTIAHVLDLTPPKVSKELRKFQITKWTDVQRSVNKDGYQLFKLMLYKYVVGYVAYDKENDIHFHADTIEEAVSGLKNKVTKVLEERKADEELSATKWTAKQLNAKYGFCWPGMTEFAHACGIDRDKEYTVKQLRDAIKNISDKYVLNKYCRELRLINVLTK